MINKDKAIELARMFSVSYKYYVTDEFKTMDKPIMYKGEPCWVVKVPHMHKELVLDSISYFFIISAVTKDCVWHGNFRNFFSTVDNKVRFELRKYFCFS